MIADLSGLRNSGHAPEEEESERALGDPRLFLANEPIGGARGGPDG